MSAACVLQFNGQRTNTIWEKNKLGITLFFQLLNYFFFWFSFSPLRYLLWEKYRNYPLTTTQGDRLASCENIVSRTRSRLSPLVRHVIRANVNKPSDVNVYHANDSYKVKKACRKGRLCWGTWSHFYGLKNLATKKHNSQECGDKEIKSNESVKATPPATGTGHCPFSLYTL